MLNVGFLLLLTLTQGAGFPPPADSFHWFMVDTAKVITSEGAGQFYPRILFDGENFIAVWMDGRRSMADDTRLSIYACRVNSQGRIIDSLGKMIERIPADYELYELACAKSSNNILVVWEQQLTVTNPVILAKRIDRDINVIDSIPIVISSDDGWFPRATFGDGYYFIVWIGRGDTLWARRINPDGILIDSVPIHIYSAPPNHIEDYQITSDGNNYFLAIQELEFDRLLGLKINPEGIVIDTIIIFQDTTMPLDIEHYEFGLTFGNDYYFVSFIHETSSCAKLSGARITTDGFVIDSFPILIDSVIFAGELKNLMVSAGDGIYLVIFESYYEEETEEDLYFKRVSANGQVLDSTLVPITQQYFGQKEPSVTFGGNNFIAVWEDWIVEDPDIRYTRITPDGGVLDPDGLILSTAATTKNYPSCAYDGSNYLVVWEDNRNSHTGSSIPQKMTDIYGVLVRPEGGAFDSAFAISEHDSIQTRPKVCFGGDNYFIVWTDLRNYSRLGNPDDIYGARVTNEGCVLDPSAIPIFTRYNVNEFGSDVAFDGINYLIVCQIAWFGRYDIYGTRISQVGIVLDTNGFLIHQSSECRFPAVAFNGSKYLVAWKEENWLAPQSYINGIFVYPDASLSDTFRISFDPRFAAPTSDPPVIASNGNDFFVAWARQTAPRGQCFGTRVTNEGNVLDTVGIPLGGTFPTSLAFDGIDYVLLRGRGYKLNISFITQGGLPLDTSGIDVLQNQYPVWEARMAKGASDQFLLTVANFSPEPYNTKRVYGSIFHRTAVTENKESPHPFSLSLFPTIVKNNLLLELNLRGKQTTSFKIYGVDGRLLKNLPINSENLKPGKYKFKLNLSSLPSGVYFLKTEPVKTIKKFVISK